jgi:glycosyltransferase involved in cell wall biosynthesis
MDPRVSFVVPCYNYGRFVGQAIESLLDQTFTALELIVVDDASTDDTPQLLERYASDPRVKIIRHEKNMRHLRSYNEGLALARGEFMGLMSADDFCVRRDAVERQVACFDAHPRVGYVASSYALTDQHGTIEWVKSRWEHDVVYAGYDEFARLAFECYVPHSGTLIRRSCHDELGYYDLRLPHSGDWDLWLRIASRYDVAYLSDAMYAYRMHPTNMHHAKFSPAETTNDHVLTIRKAFESLPEDAPDAIKALRTSALEQAWLRSAAIECSSGRPRRAAIALADAAKRCPSLIGTRAFMAQSAKLGIELSVGHERYNVLANQWRSRRRAAVTAGAQA